MACKHGINIHIYADVTQLDLYLSFDVSDDMSECLKKMEKCVCENREWMRKNMLKLNDEKTEVLVISTTNFTDRLHEPQLRIGDASAQVSESAHNRGVIFDNNFYMSNHIKTVCRTSSMQLRHLTSIQDTLAHDSLQKVSHAFIGSCMDYFDALLYSLPQ